MEVAVHQQVPTPIRTFYETNDAKWRLHNVVFFRWREVIKKEVLTMTKKKSPFTGLPINTAKAIELVKHHLQKQLILYFFFIVRCLCLGVQDSDSFCVSKTKMASSRCFSTVTSRTSPWRQVCAGSACCRPI